jgi:hypothetical protein
LLEKKRVRRKWEREREREREDSLYIHQQIKKLEVKQ